MRERRARESGRYSDAVVKEWLAVYPFRFRGARRWHGARIPLGGEPDTLLGGNAGHGPPPVAGADAGRMAALHEKAIRCQVAAGAAVLWCSPLPPGRSANFLANPAALVVTEYAAATRPLTVSSSQTRLCRSPRSNPTVRCPFASLDLSMAILSFPSSTARCRPSWHCAGEGGLLIPSGKLDAGGSGSAGGSLLGGSTLPLCLPTWKPEDLRQGTLVLWAVDARGEVSLGFAGASR